MKIDNILLPGESHRSSRNRPSQRPSVDPDVRSRDVFDNALVEARSRQRLRPALHQRLEALAGPAPADTGSFANGRSIDLLRHVVDSVLPQLDDDETQAIAKTILEEEIDWREAWQSRLEDSSTHVFDSAGLFDNAGKDQERL